MMLFALSWFGNSRQRGLHLTGIGHNPLWVTLGNIPSGLGANGSG